MLDQTADTALWLQIYGQIREGIVSGRLPAGSRVPASRALATDVVVSRNSVVAAYDQLRAEGYIEQRVRQGTFVAAVAPDTLARPRHSSARRVAGVRAPAPSVASPRLSPAGAAFVATAQRLATLANRGNAPATARPFRMGDPGTDVFPVRLWSRLIAKRWRASSVPLGYSAATGYRPLREAIAAYLATSRGVRCVAAQVFIVSGAQQAFDLATRLVLEPGDAVWMEDPGYPRARSAIEGAGGVIVPVPVDAGGLDVAAGVRASPLARLVYVTPSHQFPLGAVMGFARRTALLEWAASANAWILEDDYDSEFRYASRPFPSLQGLDRDGRVIYAGTFSKTLFPALRLAYVVAPPSLVDAFAAACVLGGRFAPSETQMVVTDFITEGHYDRHLRRMRNLYATRQQALVAYAGEYLSKWIEIAPATAGLHLVGWLRERGTNAFSIVERAANAGIELEALSACSSRRLLRDAVLLGYGPFDERRLLAGTVQLAQALSGSWTRSGQGTSGARRR